MTLIELREQLMKTAGWYDLVNDDLSDNGCNKFINAGIQHLEMQLGWHTQVSLLNKTLPANDTMIPLHNPRYVVAVYEVGEDGERHTVEWWSSAEQAVGSGETEPVRQIRVRPKDYERDMVVRAVWHLVPLEDDTDYNFWTLQYPNLVELAAQLCREMHMRNSQGVADFWEPVQQQCMKIYHDLVQEEMAGRPEQWVKPG